MPPEKTGEEKDAYAKDRENQNGDESTQKKARLGGLAAGGNHIAGARGRTFHDWCYGCWSRRWIDGIGSASGRRSSVDRLPRFRANVFLGTAVDRRMLWRLSWRSYGRCVGAHSSWRGNWLCDNGLSSDWARRADLGLASGAWASNTGKIDRHTELRLAARAMKNNLLR